MKRTALFVSLLVVLSCATRTSTPASPTAPISSGTTASKPLSVQLLAFNDLHGYLEPPTGTNGRVGSVDAGGVEYLATHLRSAIAQEPRSIVVAAGDLIGASPLISSYFHDEPTIEALNAMGLAVASVGNHEFDEGADELLRMKRGGCHPRDGCQDGDGFAGAKFDYLSANVINKKTGQTLLPPVSVRSVGGVKIGFIGITTVETPTIVDPSVGRAFEFRDEAEVANAQATELRRLGVGAIVLLIHEGMRQRPAEGDPIDPNGCVSPSGPLERMLPKLSADIAVVVSGHAHAFYNCQLGGRLVTSAGSNGRVLTRIRLQIDPGTGRISSATATNSVVTRDVAKDPALTKLIAKYAPMVTKIANAVVGSVTADLRHQGNAAGESALGAIVADAQLEAASPADRGGAVVAFMNPGGIRADVLAKLPAAAAPTPPGRANGPVTYGDLSNVHPFGNTVMTFTMTGDMIRRLLEQQFEGLTGSRRTILQVSRGFTYRYRASAPAGQHVEAGSIQLNGKPIAPTDRIRVAAVDFLRNGGDAFTVFTEGTDAQVVMVELDALIAYFKKHSPVSPPALGRITRLDQPETGARGR